ncbi:MAG TPA: ABC transporter ATP-binding protein [bacterium]|nr:ABC transporter ATP-binding protein [bacterium]HPO07480.1 ABC transporter ATP-binding protein [bacterium]HQP97057.1 ABC transporter ATP-binding protein [bacterium]
MNTELPLRVECHDLRKVYPDGTEALKGITLTLTEGLFGLLGPNGAGKTTLMEIITLLLAPTSGRLTLCGLDTRKHETRIRSLLGYLPQFFGYYPELTAQEFLTYIGRLHNLSRHSARDRARDLLRMVRLEEVRNKRLSTFSGGMLRRVGIAQALMGDPKILIVDEPTAGLDPEERVHFRNDLFELGEGRVVILSTHIVGDVEETCSRMALISDGQLRYCGSPMDFVSPAEGRIWEFVGSSDDLEGLMGQGNLVQVREQPDGLAFRVAAPEPPRPTARPVLPTLEDAYVLFLGGDTRRVGSSPSVG